MENLQIWKNWVAPQRIHNISTDEEEEAKWRMEEANRLCGGEVKSRYWGGGGWYVSANEHAVIPFSVGDRSWRNFVPCE